MSGKRPRAVLVVDATGASLPHLGQTSYGGGSKPAYKKPRSSGSGDASSGSGAVDRFEEERARFMSGDVASIMAATSGRGSSSSSSSARPDGQGGGYGRAGGGAGARAGTGELLDFRRALDDVRNLGAAHMSKPKNRKELEAKKMAALGAKVTWKPTTMPYKMYLGVTKARKARQAKADEEAKAAQLVGHQYGSSSSSSKARAKKAAKARARRGRGGEDDDTPEPSNIRGPVMYIGK